MSLARWAAVSDEEVHMERSMWQRGIRLLLTAAGTTALIGCGDASQSGTEPLSESQAGLFSSTQWTLWPSRVARICWDGAEVNAPLLASFRANVKASLEHHLA